MIHISFIHFCLRKRSGIDSLEFYLVCGIDTTKLTLIQKCLHKEWFTHLSDNRIILALCDCEAAEINAFDSLYVDTW